MASSILVIWRDSPRGQPNLLLQPFTIHVFDRCILRRAASACSSLSPEPVTGYSLARLLAGWLFVFDPSTTAKIRVAVQQEPTTVSQRFVADGRCNGSPHVRI